MFIMGRKRVEPPKLGYEPAPKPAEPEPAPDIAPPDDEPTPDVEIAEGGEDA